MIRTDKLSDEYGWRTWIMCGQRFNGKTQAAHDFVVRAASADCMRQYNVAITGVNQHAFRGLWDRELHARHRGLDLHLRVCYAPYNSFTDALMGVQWDFVLIDEIDLLGPKDTQIKLLETAARCLRHTPRDGMDGAGGGRLIISSCDINLPLACVPQPLLLTCDTKASLMNGMRQEKNFSGSAF